MNKSMILLIVACFSLPARAAQDDARLDLAISEFSYEVFESVIKTYDQIQLDIEVSPRFFKANGALRYSVDGDGFPVSGTCSVTGEDVVFCAIDASFASLYLELDGDLNGTYILLDAGGSYISEGEVTFLSLD